MNATNDTLQLDVAAVNASNEAGANLSANGLVTTTILDVENGDNMEEAFVRHGGADEGEFVVDVILVEKQEPELSEEDARRLVAAFYAILIVMILFQSGLIWWKRKHKRSYELVTLIGLWLIPAFYSFELGYWRFLTVWMFYSTVTLAIMFLCFNKRMSSSTPRIVYTWFLSVFKVSIALGVCGYMFFLLDAFGLGHVFKLLLSETLPLDLLWYGLYYGMLGRDCAEAASDWMARVMGSGRKLSVQINNCGICSRELKDYSHLGEQAPAEKTVQLDCKHLFHEHCIRGWTIVGKKDVCPTCMEKVDLKKLYADRPWETTNLTWIKLLDAVRYLVVWNPIIFFFLQFGLHLVGLDPPESRHGPPHSMIQSG